MISHPQRVKLQRGSPDEERSWYKAQSALSPCSSAGPPSQAHRGTEAGYTLISSGMAQQSPIAGPSAPECQRLDCSKEGVKRAEKMWPARPVLCSVFRAVWDMALRCL